PIFVAGGFIEKYWSPTLYQIAEVLGVEIEETRLVWDREFAKEDLECGFGIVKAGTCCVVNFEFQAIVNGKPVIIVEHVDCVGRDIDPRWNKPHAPVDMAYRIAVTGKPSFELELSYGKHSEFLSGAPVMNAIPAVCRASPGLKGPLDIDRYWTSGRVIT
ncbi:MAG: dihydrodipicolinate reductase, partial [Novosphingobium sp.]|nr:dihydrodipicolinate reductase [Novosphingobium sp.]